MPAVNQCTGCLNSTLGGIAKKLGCILIHQHLARDDAHGTIIGSLKNRLARLRMNGCENRSGSDALAKQFLDKKLRNRPPVGRI